MQRDRDDRGDACRNGSSRRGAGDPDRLVCHIHPHRAANGNAAPIPDLHGNAYIDAQGYADPYGHAHTYTSAPGRRRHDRL